jgi:hypothetical protein
LQCWRPIRLPFQIRSGDAIYDLQDGTTVDVWGGDAILCIRGALDFRPPQHGLPSFGYTYQLLNHPLVEASRFRRGHPQLEE